MTTSLQDSRLAAADPPTVDAGWTVQRLTPPSHLFGANGLRTGPDGRIYVAQVSGSQISALDVATGQLETISPKGGEIVAPDDVAFGPRGDLYVTEVMDARVSVLGGDGHSRVLRDDVPGANGITFHQGRLFIDECRMAGRLLELDLTGGEPRVLLEDLPLPNALDAGPDGLLYFPLMGANEIWRVDPEGGAAERVVGDLGVPVAVKFDSKGYIVSTQVQSGEVLRIDPRTGDAAVLAALDPGLDNLTFVGDRLFVSNFADGSPRFSAPARPAQLLPGGLNWPLDLAIGDDGQLYVADGTHFYVLPPGGKLQSRRDAVHVRAIRVLCEVWLPLRGGGFVVTTSGGQVAALHAHGQQERGARRRFRPTLRRGDRARRSHRRRGARRGARAVDPLARSRGAGIGSSRSAGRGDRSGRRLPRLRAGAGRVVELSGSRSQRWSTAGSDRTAFSSSTSALRGRRRAPSRSSRSTWRPATGARSPPACRSVHRPESPQAAAGLPPFSGPQGPFTGIAAGPDGTIYVSADAEGSVLAIRRRS